MRVHLEYVQCGGSGIFFQCGGRAAEIDYATLKTKIVGVSQERGSNVGEHSGYKYVDITLDKGKWDLIPEEQRPKNRIDGAKFGVTLEELASLTNALGVRKPQELKNMEVITLYHRRCGDRYDLLGFIRPLDKVELEK